MSACELRRRRGRRFAPSTRPRRPRLSRHPRRHLRRRRPPRQVARPSGGWATAPRSAIQCLAQLDPAPDRAHLLVALGLGEVEGQERGELHRRVRGRALCNEARRRSVGRAWSAATSTTPAMQCERSPASATSTPATGSRAAPAIIERTTARLEIVHWTSSAPAIEVPSASCRRDASPPRRGDERRGCSSRPTLGGRRSTASSARWSARERRAARPSASSVETLTPADFKTCAMPTYPEIRLALATPIGRIAPRCAAGVRCSVHIATEGPDRLRSPGDGASTRRAVRFTTSYHTRFPEYLAARAADPAALELRGWLRRFHNAGDGMHGRRRHRCEQDARGRMASASSMPWSRGVDARSVLSRAEPSPLACRGRCSSMSAASRSRRTSAFLGLDLPGSKVVVGDGPARPAHAGPISACAFSRRTHRAGARRCLCVGRRHGLSKPDRYVRDGAARGAGLRACRSRRFR
jgi:hypothetical protein